MASSTRQFASAVEKARKVLVFAPMPSGGLAEHAYYQARALDKLGLGVICLASKQFLPWRESNFVLRRSLFNMPSSKLPKWVRRPRQLFALLANQYLLAWNVVARRPDFILLDAYCEYLSPLWVWPHWMLRILFGVRYVANLHDPVRKSFVGPAWWHNLSCRLAYRPLRLALVHGAVKPEARIPSWVQTVEVPVGVYEIRPSAVSRSEIRKRWGVQDGQKVFLSFGYVRDGKNLDLAIRALAEVTSAFLVITGSMASGLERPFAFYRKLANDLGVTGRCFLEEGFVPDDELGGIFDGADYVLLTYSASFHSQSGVLNIAARARKPVLASAAPGPLVEAVRQFRLGVVIEPDSAAAVAQGMEELIASNLLPGWADYEEFAGWDTNARRLLEALEVLSNRPSTSSIPAISRDKAV